jgi:hypothetical protein
MARFEESPAFLNAMIPGMPGFLGVARDGWRCPLCGVVYSPDVDKCECLRGAVRTVVSFEESMARVKDADTGTPSPHVRSSPYEYETTVPIIDSWAYQAWWPVLDEHF